MLGSCVFLPLGIQYRFHGVKNWEQLNTENLSFQGICSSVKMYLYQMRVLLIHMTKFDPMCIKPGQMHFPLYKDVCGTLTAIYNN